MGGEKKNQLDLEEKLFPDSDWGPGRGWRGPERKNGFSKVTTPLEKKCLKNGGVIYGLGSIGSDGSRGRLLCSTCFVQKQSITKLKKKVLPEMDFPLGAGISAGIYLSIPHLAMAHGLESTGK